MQRPHIRALHLEVEPKYVGDVNLLARLTPGRPDRLLTSSLWRELGMASGYLWRALAAWALPCQVNTDGYSAHGDFPSDYADGENHHGSSETGRWSARAGSLLFYSFKPTPHRRSDYMADTACHALNAPLRRGLTWALGPSPTDVEPRSKK